MTDFIQLAQGGGGRLSRDLIQTEIVSRFGAGPLQGLPDAARLPFAGTSLLFTTDSFVVKPTEFPGGNIGDLAVHGTVNDLAVSGGNPRWLSMGLILEEGLPLAVLQRVLDSLRAAANDCGVSVVTGDTKVVARGQCDGIYINTAGIGEALPDFNVSPDRMAVGDIILVSGPVGDHGMAVLAAREGIRIEGGPVSDTAPVHRLVQAAQPQAADVHFMRDPTRGGCSAVLNEMAEGRPVDIVLTESAIPFAKGTKSAAEMLGLDLLHVASEGRMLLVAKPEAARAILARWNTMPEGRLAAEIGVVTTGKGRVILDTLIGGRRLVDVPRGELLPRIC